MNVESEREDGEIVEEEEDGELEQVSDCSMSSPYSGKCCAYQDLIRSVSLSSISDSDLIGGGDENDKLVPSCKAIVKERYKRSRHNYHRNGKKRKHRSRHRRNLPSSTDSENDNKVDYRMLMQLKDAVRINRSHDGTKNDLGTRLKKMNEPVRVENSVELDVLRAMALCSNINNKINEDNNDCLRNDDMELDSNSEEKNTVDNMEDPELRELRLAALKTAIIRKHEKRKQKLSGNRIEEVDVNKENTNDNVMDDKNNKNNSDDADEKMFGKINEEEDLDIMRAMLLASMSNKITCKTSLDIDKEDQTVRTPVQLVKNFVQNSKKTFQSKVNNKKQLNFIREPIKPIIINLNDDTDSDTENTGKNSSQESCIKPKVDELLRQVRSEFEAKKAASSQPPRTNVFAHTEEETDKNNTLDMSKSFVKYMPKAKRLEYQLLKQKLINAKKRKLRKISQRTADKQRTLSDKNSETVVNSVCVKNSNSIKKDTQHEAFKEIRLQTKGKYKDLAPLLAKMDQASATRRMYEKKVKLLLQELQQARSILSIATNTCDGLMKRLFQQKAIIDKRLKVNGNFRKLQTTSTPTKPNEKIDEGAKLEDRSNISGDNCGNGTKPIAEKELREREKKIEVGGKGIHKKQLNESNVVPEYISPLSRNDTKGDPTVAFCPYETFGVCKDPDCNFKHYL